ncbi:isopenicillin N synthase family dioxygenase [Rhizobacter sp. P5_C2]
MTAERIPTIDLGLPTNTFDRKRIADEIDRHCRDIGFFVLTGHGISFDLQLQVLRQANQFFSQSAGDKAKVAIGMSDVHRGYARIDAEKLDPDGPSDFRETYLVGWERRDGTPLPQRIPLLGLNQWPETLPDFRETLNGYYDAALEVAKQILDCVSYAIAPAEQNVFSEFFNDPLTNLVLAHYPVAAHLGDDSVLGCGEHTDYGLITLLMHDGVPGLQVQARSGAWLDVQCNKGDLVVNLGDMLEFMSGGRYVSNPHRVVVMRNQPRTSVPFFVQPDYDALIRPLLEPIEEMSNRSRWKPRLGGAYIEERFAETFPRPTDRLLRELERMSTDQRQALGKCARLLQLISD